ncbi:Clathrin interactor EPSIN 2 [Linum perenne]
MKKVFDQTVRDLKREMNKKVLKVPGIEQKVLDATSNEPWGPHGSLLADIAHATKNYHEYQMIMSIIWKRINDTGKNWRHVYKGLTVLEYLVAHGSERVIDDIKEHAYQISTLSEFQYIDSSGRDQGSNVRKKSQNLVALVNDKERIIEVRQKAASNRERFSSPSAGGMYRPGSNPSGGYGERYDDDRYEGRYGNRDEERNGYGRERENNYRDDGRYGDSYNRDGMRDEERYGRDGYRDDGYRGRSHSNDGYGVRGRSSDRDRGYDEEGQYSSRPLERKYSEQNIGALANDGRPLERKYSEQNIGAPPSYEETVNDPHSPAHIEKNGETSAPSGPVDSSPPAPQSSSSPAPQYANSKAFEEPSGFSSSASPANQEVLVDEFDPRNAFAAFPASSAAPATTSAAPTPANNAEMDLLGSLSDSFGPMAIVPASSPTITSEPDSQPSYAAPSFASTQPPPTFANQGFEDPFGETPFKAVPTAGVLPEQQQPSVSSASFQNSVHPNTGMENNSPFGDPASSSGYSAPNFHSTSANSQFSPQELTSSHQETDILADILPPSGPSGPAPQAGFPAQTDQSQFPVGNVYGNFNSQTGSPVTAAPNMAPPTSQFSGGNGSFLPQGGPMGPTSGFATQSGYGAPVAHQIPHQMTAGPSGQLNNGNMTPYPNAASSMSSQAAYYSPQQNTGALGGLYGQGGANTPLTSQPGAQSLASQPSLSSSTGALVPVSQPSNDKFETKSTVWADTLSRGLVNLNISGSKTNPLADIGVDFDAINRKEKRMSKPTTTNVTSTITMGKAMGSGSGVGRAGATSIRPQQPSNMMMNPGGGMGMGGVPGSNMGMGGSPAPGMGMGGGPMGMGGGSAPGMGMGGYGRMGPQPMGMNGMGMNGMGMGMNGMGMGNMPPRGQPPQQGPPMMSMPGGYNNNMMMGGGGYPPQQYPQQPYGRGYQ